MIGRVGVCCVAFKSKSLPEIVSLAADAGAEGIEIWAQPPHIKYPIDRSRCAEIRDLAEDKGVPVIAVGSYLRPGAKTVLDGALLTVQNQLELVEVFGVPIIRIWAGGTDYGDASRLEYESAISGIQEFADAAAEGLTIVLERHSGTLTSGWDSPEEVLSSIDRPNVSLNYQTVFPAAVSELKTKAVEDYRRLITLSSHAHVQNYRQSADGTLSRCFLDEGLVDYTSLGNAAAASGYRGAFMVEFLPDETGNLSERGALEREVKYLKSCVAAVR